MLRERNTKGLFYSLYNDLRKYDEKFFNFTRMSTNSFDELLRYIENDIRGQNTNFRESIVPEENLLVTLRYETILQFFVNCECAVLTLSLIHI